MEKKRSIGNISFYERSSWLGKKHKKNEKKTRGLHSIKRNDLNSKKELMAHFLQYCHPSRIAFDLPELLEIQRVGFNRFLKEGISHLFSEIAPITVEEENFLFKLVLDGSKYQLISPDDNPRDCILKMKTYSCKLYVKAKVVCMTKSGKLLGTTKEEWILVGHLPLMTKRGHFLINGSPRVIVHQIVRSPGIYFQQVLDKDENKRTRFYGDIIPFRGVWLRLQITKKGKIEAKFKKGKKVSAAMLEKCLQLIERYQNSQCLKLDSNLTKEEKQKQTLKLKATPGFDKIKRSSEFAYKRRQRWVEFNFKKKADFFEFVGGQESKALLDTYDKLYRPMEDKEKEEITKKGGNHSFQNFLFADNKFKLKKCYNNLSSTFKEKDRYNLSDLGREKINTKLGINVFEPQLTALDIKAASNWLHKLRKGEQSVDDIDHFQNRRIRTSSELLQIQFETGIDRLRKLAWNKLKEHVTNQYSQSTTTKNSNSTPNSNKDLKSQNTNSIKSTRDARLKQKKNEVLGSVSYEVSRRTFTRIESYKCSLLTSISLKDLLSTKPINGALREFFGTNPLSQYMDQTNPLAEMTHKRRMSSLGIGGVSRESAGMAIRGIHPTHYGRICPIETPEGKNAGLVNSLAFFSKINSKGFLETPYYKVRKGQVQPELGLTFFSAKRESLSHLHIAPSDLQQSWNNKLPRNTVPVRLADNLLDLFQKVKAETVDCIGVSPIQMISVATSLIPFLEHNDANRALMGSNMQRQAVPLMIPERPIVGTGFESLVVVESGHISQAELTGFVSYVSADKILVESFISKVRQPFVYAGKVKEVREVSSIKKVHRKTFLKRILDPLKFSVKKKRKREETNFLIRQLHVYEISFQRDIVKHIFHRRQRKLSFRNYVPTYKKYQKNKLDDVVFCTKKAETKKDDFHKRSIQNCDKRKQEVVFQMQHNAISLGVPFSVRESRNSGPPHRWSRNYVPILRNFVPITLFHSFFNTISYSYALSYQSKGGQSRFQQLVPSIHLINSFDRSNQDTCLMQRAATNEGDWVQKGDILTDCSASDKGELSVGKNILVAYMPWEGLNFEDAIVINERLVKEDVYTSLHIERYDFNAQDIKEGNEWFTNDLPGIPKKRIRHLDESGLPKIGTFVKEGDILIGKLRYSNKKPTTPYERLLCDILGENNFSARDSSLYVPKGVHARVIKHKILAFSENSSIRNDLRYSLDEERKSSDPTLTRINVQQRQLLSTRSSLLMSEIKNSVSIFSSQFKKSKSPKIVHIFLGEKRPIQIGDKMSGRHGNKGVVATILPKQDMPYLADGTPVDIILNPLGVPSRMNVGQVFESLLGLAGTYLAQQFQISAFDELYGVEASQSLVYLKLYQARLQSGQNWLFQVDFPGKTRLVDGRSGQPFDQWVTVGRAYILKLIHMVNEKIHARATGPYALITQQPLRGRSQKGGQRLGEMEVWALEGFGAAYILQELLTKKSDDIVGRKEVASAILPRPFSLFDRIQLFNKRQENRLILGQPEIFKVLICELQALCLDVGVYSLNTKSFKRKFLDKVN